VVKHARADEVALTIDVNKNLTISIQDNGVGFDKNNVRPYSNGLQNIEKRMKDINGFADIQNNAGTTVILSAPL
jgi:signal transduction histidine kinase